MDIKKVEFEVIPSSWLEWGNKGLFKVNDVKIHLKSKREVFVPNERDYISNNTLDYFVKIVKSDGKWTYYSFYKIMYWVYNDPRPLSFWEFIGWLKGNKCDIHHINGNHFDNRPENLEIMNYKEHEELHKNNGMPIG